MKFTILGASGFIGENMCKHLAENGIECFAPKRDYIFDREVNYGHIIYAIGLTADFREKPLETVKAHVCKLVKVLENSTFVSFTYLSSTRVYIKTQDQSTETSDLTVQPTNLDDLYNISKLMGESVCMSFDNPNIRVVRISNVIGDYKKADNFLSSILHEIKTTHVLKLRSSLDSSKDYIIIEDVVDLLLNISVYGKKRIYNLASGNNITNSQIIQLLSSIEDFELHQANDSPAINFIPIDISSIKEEFGFSPSDVLKKITTLSKNYLGKN